MDETQEERRRRQQREATARWQAKNKDKIAAYAKARRLANLDEARRRDREAKKRWYDANPELARARSNAFAAKNREPAKVRAAEWRKQNPARVRELSAVGKQKRKDNWDRFLAWERERYRRDPERKLEQQKTYRANPSFLPKSREYHREYRRLHPELSAMYSAARTAAKLNATPFWCDFDAVAKIYERARKLSIETGIDYEVDHIVPLRGKHVRGLHVPYNLQILTRTENRRKHNKLIHGETSGQGEVGLPTKIPVPGFPPAQGTLGLHSGSSPGRKNSSVRDGSDRSRTSLQKGRRALRLHEPDIHASQGHIMELFEEVHC
jgi:hypothetical protein